MLSESSNENDWTPVYVLEIRSNNFTRESSKRSEFAKQLAGFGGERGWRCKLPFATIGFRGKPMKDFLI